MKLPDAHVKRPNDRVERPCAGAEPRDAHAEPIDAAPKLRGSRRERSDARSEPTGARLEPMLARAESCEDRGQRHALDAITAEALEMTIGLRAKTSLLDAMTRLPTDRLRGPPERDQRHGLRALGKRETTAPHALLMAGLAFGTSVEAVVVPGLTATTIVGRATRMDVLDPPGDRFDIDHAPLQIDPDDAPPCALASAKDTNCPITPIHPRP